MESAFLYDSVCHTIYLVSFYSDREAEPDGQLNALQSLSEGVYGGLSSVGKSH